MKINFRMGIALLTLIMMMFIGALCLSTGGASAAALKSGDKNSARQPATAVTTVSADGASVSVSLARPGRPELAPSRVIVRFRSGTGFLAGSGRSSKIFRQHNVHLVENPPGLSVSQVIERYKANPNVLYAEPDYRVNAVETTPSDPLYGNQWDMVKIAAPAAWGLHNDSDGTVVAVVDTGIDYNHPDLVENLYSDSSLNHGYTCMNGSCVPGGFDDHGHGTHVAGTIGAATNNGTGVAGINWKIKLLSIKFLGSGGSGSVSDAVLGFEKLLDLKKSGVNIRVTNNSWGGGGYSQALKDAMAELEKEQTIDCPTCPSTLNVCAAGNSGVNADFSPMYPAAYDSRGIVSVLATDSNDTGAGFTNYGLASVDIAAPGVGIFSTEATGTCSLCDTSGYRTLSGTSMASPHVAGVAAALLDMYKVVYPNLPDLTAAQARDALLDPAGYDWMVNTKAQSTSSGGRLNFYKTITNDAFLSSPVLNQFPTVTVGPDVFTTQDGTVNFTQSASDPDDDQNSLRMATGRGPVATAGGWLFGWHLYSLFPNGVPFTAPSLARTAVMPYQTSVADNRGGGASGRNWAVVFPGNTPGTPPIGVLDVPATGTVNVPVTIGFVTTDPDHDTVAWDLWVAGPGSSGGSCCSTGASAGRTFSQVGNYRIIVQAMDSRLGTSEVYTKEISITNGTTLPTNGHVPAAVATVSPESGPAPLTVNVDLSGSYDEDGTIIAYFNSCGVDLAAGSSNPKSTCTFTDPGTYWLLLDVQDNKGNLSTVSKYVVVYPTRDGAPIPPGSLTATAGSVLQINLTWSDNSNNEEGFKIERSPDGTTWSQIALVGANLQSYADESLAPGTTYYYRVRATSVAGDSGYSNTAGATTQAAPTASFSANPTSGQMPLEVVFSNSSSGSIDTYLWSFGDGATSSEQAPGHTYTTAGTFSVSLTVTGPGGSDTKTKDGYVRALPVADLKLSLTASADTVFVGDTITYQATVSNQGPHGATGVRLTDSLPAGLTLLSVTPAQNCTNSQGSLLCTLGAMDSGGSVTVTITGILNAAGQVLDSATVTADSVDPVNDNSRSVYTTVLLPEIGIVASDPDAGETGPDIGKLRVTRIGSTTAALDVFYSVGGTATNGSDYSFLSGHVTIPAGSTAADIVVTPVDDSFYEGSETVIVTLSANPAYRVGAPDSGTVTISDNDPPPPTVRVVATDASAAERKQDKGALTFTRTGSTTAPLTVRFTLGGTATNGVDYKTLPTTVTIPAGYSSKILTVTPVNDRLREGTETVIVTLSPDTSYAIGTSGSATVSILDND